MEAYTIISVVREVNKLGRVAAALSRLVNVLSRF